MNPPNHPRPFVPSLRSVLPLLVLGGGLALTVTATAGILDFLGDKKSSSKTPNALLTQALGNDQMVAGLKEALGKGVEQAVSRLGTEGGFLTNVTVKIPVPESLRRVERLARAAGQEKLADDFVASLNHAAEKAVPAAAAVFGEALQQMSIDDAKNILTGPVDAATQFFARTTRTNLYERFHPLVEQATADVGVTGAYKKLSSRVADADLLGGGLVGNLRKAVTDQKPPDLDGYVTDKALDGLFKMVAEEEKRIRENPVARTTDLLKSVFGAIAK